MAGRSRANRSLPQRLWGFLASRKVAVVLLLAALSLLLVGTWTAQAPGELDPAGLEQWQATMQQRYGSSSLHERLGLSHLFRTPTFLALAAALLVNTVACTIDRLGRLWRSATHRPVTVLPAAAYEHAREQTQGVSPEQARRILRGFGCRLHEEIPDEKPPEPADTGARFYYLGSFRLASLGTVLTHLGLLLFIPAAFLHTSLAWKEWFVLDPPLSSGATAATPLQRRPDCSVANVGFAASVSEGRFQGGQGELLVRQGSRILRSRVAPSAPLSACGTSFHLDSYGLALGVRAFDDRGQPLQVTFPLTGTTSLHFVEGTAAGSFDIPALRARVTVIPSAQGLVGLFQEPLFLRIDQAGLSAPLFQGNVDPQEGLSLPGLRLELRSGIYLKVLAAHDPGFPIFLTAGLALVLGSTSSLLFPRRCLWARLTAAGTLQVCRSSAGQEELVPERLGHGGER